MKFRLALYNVVFSQLFIMSFLFFAYFIWFPHSLVELSEFKRLAITLTLVNLILGPLLVIFINKKGKKKVKFDLIVLFLVQISAICFGIYSISQQRPVYAVFTVDRFTLIDAKSAIPEKSRFREFDLSPLSGPKLVYAKSPEDNNKSNEILMGFMFNGEPDLDGRSEFYEPYSRYTVEILKKGLVIEEILQVTGSKEKFKKFIEMYGGNKNSYAYLPLQTNNRDVIWVLDIKTAEPVGILDINPWQV